jgi:hypothetical protein
MKLMELIDPRKPKEFDMAENFEDQYLGVLQNIEFGLVTVYRDQPTLVDTGTMYALDILIKAYTEELRGREITPPQFKPEEQAAYNNVREVCEWRLGRAPMTDVKGRKLEADIKPISVEEIIACLRRIRKSVDRWYRENGRRGYFEFISKYVQ